MNRIVKAALVLAALAGSTARADVIAPWAGASASVQVFVPEDSASTQAGPTASASSSKTQEVRYFGGIATDYSNPYRTQVNGSADAQATGKAEDLLHLNASYLANNPGTTPRIQPDRTQLPVAAQAAWIGDRLTVHAPPGSSLPETVRLNFSLGFQGSQNSVHSYSDGTDLSSIAINANGLTASIERIPSQSGYLSTNFRDGTLKFDSTT